MTIPVGIVAVGTPLHPTGHDFPGTRAVQRALGASLLIRLECRSLPFVPFGMGTTIRRWEEEDLSCLEFELDEPIQFAVVLAGRYHSYSETRGDQTVTLSSYAFAQDEPMRQVAEHVFQLIDFYEGLLGEFPYPELSIIEINAFGFGIAKMTPKSIY